MPEIPAHPDEWRDERDEWSDRIDEAHPARSGSHEAYSLAMALVGHRHSKAALVALVNYLIVENRKLTQKREETP